MSLAVDIRKSLGGFRLDARFESQARVTAIFGHSGAGKTSLINAIAGLLQPERGRIVVDGTVLFDGDEGIDVPVHRRRIGYVFQESRLFPHLSVRHNLLYGQWFSGAESKASAFGEVVELLGLAQLLQRDTDALSGGEKQRVAIGRALLTSARLLLMDEPLSSLDEARKREVMPFLERLRDQAGVPIVYVSHSLAEVARLASTVVLMSEGRVLRVGSTEDVLSEVQSNLTLAGLPL